MAHKKRHHHGHHVGRPKHHQSHAARHHESVGEEHYHEEHPFGHHRGRPTDAMEERHHHGHHMRHEHHDPHHRSHHSDPPRHHSSHPKHGVMGGLGAEYYAGYDPRRTLEHRDGEMISEDRGAIANMPQHAFQREWPREMYATENIRPDNISGIDHQMSNDMRDIRSNRMHNKA